MIISLIGFMGCGKSSVGRRLSELLCCPFMDLDDVITEAAGRSIPEIFASDGEAAFRKMEKDILHDVIGQFPMYSRGSLPLRGPLPPDQEWHNSEFVHQAEVSYEQDSQQAKSLERVSAVLALGGGTVMTPECAEMAREKTLCIYLRASVDTLISHLEGESSGRPMLYATTPLRGRIEDLMSLRSATYEKTAHVTIDTDGKSIESVAQDISDHIM